MSPPPGSYREWATTMKTSACITSNACNEFVSSLKQWQCCSSMPVAFSAYETSFRRRTHATTRREYRLCLKWLFVSFRQRTFEPSRAENTKSTKLCHLIQLIKLAKKVARPKRLYSRVCLMFRLEGKSSLDVLGQAPSLRSAVAVHLQRADQSRKQSIFSYLTGYSAIDYLKNGL